MRTRLGFLWTEWSLVWPYSAIQTAIYNGLPLQAGADTVEFIGIPEFTIAAQNVVIEINTVSAAGSLAADKVIDFAAKPVDVITGPDSMRTLDLDGSRGVLLRASALLELDIAGVLTADGSFTFERSEQLIDIQTGTEGSMDAGSQEFQSQSIGRNFDLIASDATSQSTDGVIRQSIWLGIDNTFKVYTPDEGTFSGNYDIEAGTVTITSREGRCSGRC